MRTIQKETFDRLIRLERKYHKTGDTDLLDARIRAGEQLAEQEMGKRAATVSGWLKFCDLASAIVGGRHSLKPDISDADLYEIMRILGYEVVDGKEPEE